MRPLKNMCEVAVIGAGLAGLAAARHAARLGRLVTLFESSGLYGGQLATVGHVTGLPFPGKYSGQDLAIHLLEDARKARVRVVEREIVGMAIGERLTLTDGAGESYQPAAVIVASGARLRLLNVPGEEAFYGRGVSRCATCDGGFFRGQHVVVVGGGDAAVHEALELSGTSGKVTMICRSPLKAKREYIDKLDARENVVFLWDSEVQAVMGGDAGVTGVRVRNIKTGDTGDIACEGVFPFVGLSPNAGFAPKAVTSLSGHIEAGPTLATADRRVFAAGAVRTGYGGNAAQAMAEGIGAAEAASSVAAD